MARVAFIMDRIFRRFGLSGKSFIPMLIASGCGVPAVMATKTIENEKDRRMTIMTTTMIPCGAKMPIIALVFGARRRRLCVGRGGWRPCSTSWAPPLSVRHHAEEASVRGRGAARSSWSSPVSHPDGEKRPACHVGAREVLHRQGGNHHLPVHHRHLVPHEISGWGGGVGLPDPPPEHSLMAGLGNLLAWIFAPLGFDNWQAAATAVHRLECQETSWQPWASSAAGRLRRG